MEHINPQTTSPSDTSFLAICKKLVPYLWQYKDRVLLALGALVLAKIANVVVPFVLKYIVDHLDQPTQADTILAVPLALLVGYGILRFSMVLFNELRDTVFGRVTERAMHTIGLEVFKHLHHLDLSFHLSRRTGGLSRNIDRGTNGVSFLLRILTFNIVPTLFEVSLVTGLLLINYDVWFGLITLISALLYLLFSVLITNWRIQFVKAMNSADNQASTRAIDSLLNFETVKYFTNEQYEADRYDQNLDTWEQARRKNRITLAFLNIGQSLIVAIGMTLMMILAALRVSQGDMTLGDFVLINTFAIQVFIPLNMLGFVYRELKRSLTDIEEMFGLLKQQPKIKDQAHAKPLMITSPDIVFDQVSFRYQKQRPILKKVSLTIPAGKTVAVVGPSGSGKSTLVRLLMRFYEVDSGAILINGIPIKEVTQKSLRQAIGIVPQDTVLFNDTLYHNIEYGRPGATDKEIKEAARLSHLDQLIDELPDGYNTLTGERGLKLSGGEKQRIAIARAILKDPPIMVFDEATSSLDAQSEQAIVVAMKELSKHHTTLIIAHRLATVAHADHIVVLSKGQVIEEGMHDQLLSQKGLYYQLWELQQRDSVKNPLG